jgi:hypothetical protein
MWSAVAECREPPSRRSDGLRSPSAELGPLAWPLGKRPPTEGDLNRRSQPGRHPLHRIGLGDDPINMIAIDALKHALLESDPRRLDTCQDHWTQAFGTGMEQNCYAAWIKQDR